VAGALEILEPDRVHGSRRPMDIGHPAAERLLLPVVDDERVVEEEAIPVVAFDPDAAERPRRRDDASRPSRRVPVERNAAAGRVERPAEVDPRIGARQPRRALETVVVATPPNLTHGKGVWENVAK